jgi:hypothetical protein
MKSFRTTDNEFVLVDPFIQQVIRSIFGSRNISEAGPNSNFQHHFHIKYFTLAFVLCLGIFSCKKDKIDNSCHSPTLISQIKSGELYVYDVTYTENCLIAESVEPSLYKKFTYDSQNRLKKMERALSFDVSFSCVAQPNGANDSGSDPRQARTTDYSDFEYTSNGELSKKVNYYFNNGNALLTTYQTYEYSNGHVSKLSEFNPQDKLIQYETFQYDSVGNITKISRYLLDVEGNAGLNSVTSYEFDNKINPFIIFNSTGEPGKFTNLNNITREITVTYFGASEQKYEISTVYEYNGLGLPVKSNGLVYLYGE